MHGHSLRPPTEESHARSASPGGPAQQTPTDSFFIKPPTLSLPKGGGAIRGIGEKFTANPVTGTGTISVPIAVSPGRAGFGPQLALMYDSGSGNGPFGLGWSLPLPSIARKTDKGIPQYREDDASDVFVMSGAEDLVPLQESAMGALPRETAQLDGVSYAVQRYRPRIEGLFARIERWSQVDAPENTCWRTITRENVTTWYGQNENSRIVDPSDRRRIFQWLICLTHDDKGNAAIYRYAADDDAYPDPVPVAEANRLPEARRANRYLKSIRYGNVEPYLPRLGPDDADPLPAQWLFEVVLDYGDHAGEFPSPAPDADPPRSSWTHRVDAFSTHRAGFEVRTYRLCRRVLMYHHFPDVLEVGANCLVRSTELAYALASTPEEPRSPGFTTLVSVTHASYQRTAPGSDVSPPRSATGRLHV
jgi:hypothetical protein